MTPVQLLYFANPMCSWCWGFAPVAGRLAHAYAGRAEVTVVLGQLGDRSRPMGERDKDSVRSHWDHVRELTGQPFDLAFFDREGFVYDTEPACRAVATVRAVRPALALPYLHALQRAFYAENRDVTAADELRRVAEAVGCDGEAFAAAFAARPTRATVAEEFDQTARLGVTGYPTLLALADGRARVVSLGCRPLADLEEALAPALERDGAG
jgi:putative protein-disulfide isomerase